jgi:hypothetical protein
MTEYSVKIRNDSKGRVGSNSTEIEGVGYVKSNEQSLTESLSDLGSSVDHSVSFVAELMKRGKK